MTPSGFPGQGIYEIVVQGHLDEQTGYWFEGLSLSTGFDAVGAPITSLVGRFVDQAALHGVLATIRDINLPLISVRCIAVGPTDARTTPDASRSDHDPMEVRDA